MIHTVFTSWRSWSSLVTLSAAMLLSGCQTISNINPPETTPIHTPTTGNQIFTKCPAYNAEQNICTAQYDPVCVSVKNGTKIDYRTAGNACSACNISGAISYTKGECQ